ncbi:MAG: putative quinol monooxygenase [Xenococcaceae cyanobacterium]
MSLLTVVAKFKAKSGSETAFYRELLQLIAPTLAEEGCINYDSIGFIESEEGKKILESGSNPIEFIGLFSQTISRFVDRLMSDIWQACQSTDAIIAHSILFWTY